MCSCLLRYIFLRHKRVHPAGFWSISVKLVVHYLQSSPYFVRCSKDDGTHIACLCKLAFIKVNQYCLFSIAFVSFCFKKSKQSNCNSNNFHFQILNFRKNMCFLGNFSFYKKRKNHLQGKHKMFPNHVYWKLEHAKLHQKLLCIFNLSGSFALQLHNSNILCDMVLLYSNFYAFHFTDLK